MFVAGQDLDGRRGGRRFGAGVPARRGRTRQAGDDVGEGPSFDGGVPGFTQDVGRNTAERHDKTLRVRLLAWLDRSAESALDEMDGRGRVESTQCHPGPLGDHGPLAGNHERRSAHQGERVGEMEVVDVIEHDDGVDRTERPDELSPARPSPRPRPIEEVEHGVRDVEVDHPGGGEIHHPVRLAGHPPSPGEVPQQRALPDPGARRRRRSTAVRRSPRPRRPPCPGRTDR